MPCSAVSQLTNAPAPQIPASWPTTPAQQSVFLQQLANVFAYARDAAGRQGVNVVPTAYAVYNGAQLPTLTVSGASTSLDTARHQFGLASLKLTATGATVSVAFPSGTVPISAFQRWIASVYLFTSRTAIAGTLAVITANGTYSATITSSTATSEWYRLWGDMSLVGDPATACTMQLTFTGCVVGDTFNLEGWQLEAAAGNTNLPTPFANSAAPGSVDFLPDGIKFAKTLTQYTPGNIPLAPTGGLDGLFNPSFEINTATPPNTAVSAVGAQPSDGWTIVESDLDTVTGNPFWSVSATNAGAESGTYALAFTANPGLSVLANNGVGQGKIVLRSLPMTNEQAALFWLYFWLKGSSYTATAFAGPYPANISINTYVTAYAYDPAVLSSSNNYNSWIACSPYNNYPVPSAWTEYNQLDTHGNGLNLSGLQPLVQVQIEIHYLNTNNGGASFITPTVGQLFTIDNILAYYKTDLTGQVTGVLPLANLPTIPGSVATFQSGSVAITPALGAQVTTNITLGTAVNTAKSLVTLNYGSTTPAVPSSPTRGALTSSTNLQLITDAQIGTVADTMTVNWQVLTWN